MTEVRHHPERSPAVARRFLREHPERALVSGAVVCALAVVFTPQPIVAAVAFGALLSVAASARWLLSRRGLAVSLLLVVMLVPMRQYTVADFTYALEPFRLIVAMFLGAVGVTLLVDPDARARHGLRARQGFGALVAAMLAVSLASAAANLNRITSEGLFTNVMDAFLRLGSVLGVYFLIRFVIRSREDVHRILVVTLLGAAFVALMAIMERRIGMNVFQEIDRILPIKDIAGGVAKTRAGQLRSYGSAEHPIALGALMFALAPLGVYMAARSTWPRGASPRVRRIVWGATTGAILIGAVVTMSRTIVLMGVATAVVALALRARTAWRIVLVALVLAPIVKVAAPGAVGGIRDSIWPIDSVIMEQESVSAVGDPGRVGDIGPTLDRVGETPLFGIGFGTRIVTGPRANARILDNEYLVRLLETGLVGFTVFLAFVAVPLRSMWRLARSREIPRGRSDLAAALAVSFSGMAVGFLVFDGLAYGQMVAVYMALLAVAGWLASSTVEVDDHRLEHPVDGAR